MPEGRTEREQIPPTLAGYAYEGDGGVNEREPDPRELHELRAMREELLRQPKRIDIQEAEGGFIISRTHEIGRTQRVVSSVAELLTVVAQTFEQKGER